MGRRRHRKHRGSGDSDASGAPDAGSPARRGGPRPRGNLKVGFLFTIFALCFLGGGVWMTATSIYKAATYLPVDATVEMVDSGSASVSITARYSYQVAGRRYESTETADSDAANFDTLSGFRRGERLTLYYSPSDPSVSTRRPAVDLWGIGMISFTLPFLLLGVCNLWPVLFRKELVESRRPNAQSDPVPGGGMFWVFTGLCAVAAFAQCVLASTLPWQQAAAWCLGILFVGLPGASLLAYRLIVVGRAARAEAIQQQTERLHAIGVYDVLPRGMSLAGQIAVSVAGCLVLCTVAGLFTTFAADELTAGKSSMLVLIVQPLDLFCLWLILWTVTLPGRFRRTEQFLIAPRGRCWRIPRWGVMAERIGGWTILPDRGLARAAATFAVWYSAACVVGMFPLMVATDLLTRPTAALTHGILIVAAVVGVLAAAIRHVRSGHYAVEIDMEARTISVRTVRRQAKAKFEDVQRLRLRRVPYPGRLAVNNERNRFLLIEVVGRNGSVPLHAFQWRDISGGSAAYVAARVRNELAALMEVDATRGITGSPAGKGGGSGPSWSIFQLVRSWHSESDYSDLR